MGNSLEIEPATSGQPRQVWDRPPHGLGILEAFDTQSDLGRVSYTPPVLATTDLLDVTRALAEGQDAQAVAFFQQSAGSLRALVSSAELVFDGLRWLWDADELSTVDLDIALSKLLTAFRKVATPPAMAPIPKHTSIMVANAPWDPHFQHAGMARDLLQAEGFDVALWLGQDENDLARTVAAAQVDHLVIVSSPVFAHASETRLPHFQRLASLNGGAGVVLLGRLGLAPCQYLERAGFAQYCLSALELPALVATKRRAQS